MRVTSFRVFGHRGASGYEPENTLASLEAAVALGAPWVEIDVRVVEGTPILFHDRDLLRRVGIEGLVEKQALPFLRTLDVGKGERIPLLSEALDLLRGRCSVNVELKGKGPIEPVVHELSRALQAGWETDQLLVSSFDHHKLTAFTKLLPSIPISALTSGDPLHLLDTARTLPIRAVGMEVESITEKRVHELHDAGLNVFVYTANSEEDLEHCRIIGADGVFCDFPDRALKFV